MGYRMRPFAFAEVPAQSYENGSKVGCLLFFKKGSVSNFPNNQLENQSDFQNLHWIADLIKNRSYFGCLLIFSGFDLKSFLKNALRSKKSQCWKAFNFIKNYSIAFIFWYVFFCCQGIHVAKILCSFDAHGLHRFSAENLWRNVKNAENVNQVAPIFSVKSFKVLSLLCASLYIEFTNY